MNSGRPLPIALRRAYLALHRASDLRFSKYGVTADQFVLLAELSEEKALTQRQLAARISSDPSTVRAMLVILENNGLVKRESHPEDARAKTVALTGPGKRKLQQLWKAGQSIRDKMYNALQPTEADVLIELLNRMSSALSAPSETSSRTTALTI